MGAVIVTVLAFVFLVLNSVFLVVCSRKLRAEKHRASELEPLYAPVERAEETLRQTEQEYAALRAAYERDLAVKN